MVLHLFRDGSIGQFPATVEHGKVTYYPYRKGMKKGEPIEKTITTEPMTMIKSPIGYHVYLCNDDCPTTLPPPKEVGVIEWKDEAECPKCHTSFTRDLKIATTEASPETKPVIISTSQGRGIIKALREEAKRVGRGPWLLYIAIFCMAFALGASAIFSIIVATGHYKMMIGGLLLAF